MVGISITREDVETLFVRVSLTGLTAGSKYDVYRLQIRYLGDDSSGNPVYERELPDRRDLWRAIAHRVGWTAPATTATFRDYEASMRPVRYFVVPTASVGPHEYDFADGNYPLGRGVITPNDASGVVHFNRDLRLIVDAPFQEEGHLLIRSTDELAVYHTACVVDIDGPRYQARGSEFAVMHTQFPVYVSDTREARRGTITLLSRDIGHYNEIRRIVFPQSGRIRPFIINSGGDSTLSLDDMVVIPLDVEIEQATRRDPDLRLIHLSYIETDPTAALTSRTGDNDALVSEPQAQFTISDSTPARNQWVTFTSTSTGAYDSAEWTVERGNETDNKVGKWYTEGPIQIRWSGSGQKSVKLRVYGSGAGAHTRTKVVTVH